MFFAPLDDCSQKLTEVMRELAGEFSQVDAAAPRPSASQKPVKITRIISSKVRGFAAPPPFPHSCTVITVLPRHRLD